jgi:hypothetical protein
MRGVKTDGSRREASLADGANFLFLGPGLGKFVRVAGFVLPLTALFHQVHALKTLQDVPLHLDLAGATQTFVLRHSGRRVAICLLRASGNYEKSARKQIV